MPPPDPYRDDRPTLAAEVDRLRRQLARERRGRRFWPALALLLAHVALRALAEPWLNGASDALFWIAAVLVYAPVALSAALIILALRRPKENLP